MQLNNLIQQLDAAIMQQTSVDNVKLTQEVINRLDELQELRTLCQLTGWTRVDDWIEDLPAKRNLHKCYVVYKGKVESAYYDVERDEFFPGRFPVNPYNKECIKWVRSI